VRFLWGLIQIAFNISPSHNIQHMFRIWTNQVGGKLKRQLFAGVSTFCWVIRLSRIDVVFDKFMIKSFMQVQGNSLALLLVSARKNDLDKEKFNLACRKLEMVVMHIFVDYRWKFSNRICV
jgi:hypothetical protein